MKEFLSQTFYGNTVQSWAISLGIILGSIVLAKVFYWFIGKYVKKITAKTKSSLDDIFVDKLEEPVVYGLVIIAFFWGLKRLDFGTGMDNFISHAFTIVFSLNATWLIVRVIDALIEEYIVPLVTKTDSDLDDQLMPIIRKGVKTILWSMGIIIGLNNAGFDVTALIAGLGIGGLALALAAQDTVKNVFGGIMVFIDKPFKIKERIKINGMDGFVEEIGIRTTRLRTLEGRLITIPNGQFSDNPIENVSLEPSRKVVVNLGLTYETSPDNMEKAMQILRKIAEEHEGLTENVIISFNSWGDFSMGILFIYYIKPEFDIFQVPTEINMQILRQFNEAGLEFAYPTQTIYRK